MYVDSYTGCKHVCRCMDGHGIAIYVYIFCIFMQAQAYTCICMGQLSAVDRCNDGRPHLLPSLNHIITPVHRTF